MIKPKDRELILTPMELIMKEHGSMINNTGTELKAGPMVLVMKATTKTAKKKAMVN
jgi:hypothetical protein